MEYSIECAVNLVSRSRIRNRNWPVVAEVEQEITRLLGDPRGGWLGGDAEHVDPAGGVLYDGEAVQRANVMVSAWKKSTANMPAACALRNSFSSDGSPRCGRYRLLQSGRRQIHKPRDDIAPNWVIWPPSRT